MRVQSMKLNRSQKAIAALGAAALLCLVLFPPWRQAAQRETDYRKDIGRGFILNPPRPVSVDCYFIGCKTAPSSYFHVLLYRKLLLDQLATVAGTSIVLLWLFRSRRDGTCPNLGSAKTRLQFSALVGLLVPPDGSFPFATLFVDIPRQISRHDEFWVIPVAIVLSTYALSIIIIFLLVSALVKVNVSFTRRQDVARP